ncbi:MAG: site-specific DNA-methyltransferase [Chloroflexi bacterium]|nr:site-specific DNA-methyltransferase [Chloroflexota bacterium]
MDWQKMSLESHDGTADKRAALWQLFPEARTEAGQVDWAQLQRALGEMIDTGRERYGLTWPGKADCFRAIQAPTLATLRPAPQESVAWDVAQNLLIEGDNLEVLKLLQKGYMGRVKMIYIDPPYNTGNDFIYPDNYSESLQTYMEYTGQVDGDGRRMTTNSDTDGRFHSKWLNMMYPHLYLARNLLRDDGVIFISIDDSEVSNLRKLCDEIFGEENFVANIVWNHTKQSKNDEKYFSRHHNQIIVYRKSDSLPQFLFERTEKHNENYSNPDNDPNGLWRSGDVRSPNLRNTLRYSITTPNGNIIEPPENGWRWSQESIEKKISSGEIIFSSDETKIIRKIYLANQKGRTPENLWLADFAGTTRHATAELKDLFDEPPFDTPKPSQLIKRMLEIGTNSNDNDIVLDFFAGSGTTAQAVLELNAEDGGNRRFILVQLPEPTGRTDYPTIADITKERVRRVLARQAAAPPTLFNQEQPPAGFRVFQLATSNFRPWNGDVAKTEEALLTQLSLHIQHIEQGRTAEDMLYELLLKDGYELTTAVERLTLAGKTVYRAAEGALLICLERELTLKLFREIETLAPQRIICLDTGFAGNDELKVNVAHLFKHRENVTFRTV